eukprot:5803793-Pleurochrysis_carterae.AAC.2
MADRGSKAAVSELLSEADAALLTSTSKTARCHTVCPERGPHLSSRPRGHVLAQGAQAGSRIHEVRVLPLVIRQACEGATAPMRLCQLRCRTPAAPLRDAAGYRAAARATASQTRLFRWRVTTWPFGHTPPRSSDCVPSSHSHYALYASEASQRRRAPPRARRCRQRPAAPKVLRGSRRVGSLSRTARQCSEFERQSPHASATAAAIGQRRYECARRAAPVYSSCSRPQAWRLRLSQRGPLQAWGHAATGATHPCEEVQAPLAGLASLQPPGARRSPCQTVQQRCLESTEPQRRQATTMSGSRPVFAARLASATAGVYAPGLGC